MELDVICINLAKRIDRREKVEKQARKLGLTLRFMDAVDGSQVKLDELPHYNRKKRARYFDDLVPGGAACAESHFLALDDFLGREDRAPFLLTLEDDVIFPENFKEILTEILERTSGWDCLRLQRSKKQWGIRVANIESYDIIFPLMVGLNNTGILFNERGAMAARKLFSNFMFPADHILKFAHFEGIMVYEVNPPILTQDKSKEGNIELQDGVFKETTSWLRILEMKVVRVFGQGIRILLMPYARLSFRHKKAPDIESS